MSDAIIAFLSGLTGDKKVLAALLAVIPVTEIKGCVLFVAASEGEVVLPVLAGYLSSLLLSLLLSRVVPKTYAFACRFPLARKIRSILVGRLSPRAERIAERAERSARGRENAILFGVFAFVAIPLPLTGVWAGALLAAILGLKPNHTFFALAAGNFAAGGIVLAVALLAGERASFVFDLFLLLAVALVLIAILSTIIKKNRKRSVE